MIKIIRVKDDVERERIEKGLEADGFLFAREYGHYDKPRLAFNAARDYCRSRIRYSAANEVAIIAGRGDGGIYITSVFIA